ncbi:hypothetical protein FYJ27_05205 [Anaerosalibacter bizertensis]|uniref:Uncharacterized protein n=1 Tax=Anaerosalibacter bizertensis TaxID=932217 RepID=A0A844FGQ1_9FIRM|nr:hypothetical protein [Anaerosalibacter bizertensis]MSS43131.1 hypothetical protein [Anaerosalibacter bizertensis]
MNIDINIGSFETFADYFFDEFIADWMVQSKINDSLTRVYNIDSDISSLLKTLTKESNDLENELFTVQEEIKKLIEDELV